MMKSQVNALLHVIKEGLFEDCSLTYPALREGLSKDMERLTLYCQSRGRGFFTLDLPNLNALLLKGFETGRLNLEGPLSRAVSKEVRVPRLFSGLWLRVFDKDACLKHEVDVTALAFLQMFLTFGSKLEVECSHNRICAVMGAYYDVESKLRKPTLGWTDDSFGLSGAGSLQSPSKDLFFGEDSSDGAHPGSGSWDLLTGICHSGSFHCDHPSVLHGTPIYESKYLEEYQDLGDNRLDYSAPMHVHLVQALDGSNDYISSSLPLFREELSNERRDELLEDQRLLNKVQKVADLIIGNFREYDPVGYSAQLDESNEAIGFKHGPGAVAEKLRRWEKSQFPTWPQKLQGTFPYELCGKTAQSTLERPLNHELASRLMAVPKTEKGPRLIAAEPTSHQWCQQLTWRWLRGEWRRLFKSDFIDFSNQELSGNLVLEASRDRSLATVDLSDASDRLTCWTVERMFRCNPSLLTALHAARTRYLRDEVTRDGGFLLLRKFASQGTATTFPIMSIVMAIISISSCLEGKPSWRKILELSTQVRVFGDDIIIPTHGYGRLCRIMTLLQLKVNTAKSYAAGYFRESCGVYGYMGYDVTPVRPKTIVADSPASYQAVVDITNNLFNKGYWHASTACLDLLPARVKRGIRIVGKNDTGFSGLTSFSGSDESHLIKRWNTRLHRYEVRVWSLRTKPIKRPRNGYAALLDFFASKHNFEQARVVSEYADVRKVRDDFLWEPANSCDNAFVRLERPESSRLCTIRCAFVGRSGKLLRSNSRNRRSVRSGRSIPNMARSQ